MKILSVTGGAAGMYCGSCLRDNGLAAELMRRGHEVTLVPLYTPTRSDEPNVSCPRVFFGGINLYLQQAAPVFRRTPGFFDRLLDSPRVISAFASRAVSTDPATLGEMTLSMLDGPTGPFGKEFDKFVRWLTSQPIPDVVNLPNSMIIGLARPLRQALQRPICCTLQGEDFFLEGLTEPYRSRALDSIRRQVDDVDRFIAVGEWHAQAMSGYLGIPPDRLSVVPLGINMEGCELRRSPEDGVFRVGYLARIAPEKGLHVLAAAFEHFKRRVHGADVRLNVAGYLGPAYKSYLDDVKRLLDRAGLLGDFVYHGALERPSKMSFLRANDVFSMPATYDEPKGISVLESMANGVPVVQPRRGAFAEILTRTGGGLLVDPDDADSLAEGLYTLWRDRDLRHTLGARARAGVETHYTVGRSADCLLEVYTDVQAAHQRVAAVNVPGSVSRSVE
jgi:glycosyltransferase involved in cell wall biosynthesis